MKTPFLSRYLDPFDRISEVFCGLVMVLTFTLLAGHDVAEGPGGVRDLLLAAVGCNVAWGLIDGVVYLMNQLFERERRAQMLTALRNAPDEKAARAAVESHLEPDLVALTSPEERSKISAAVLGLVSRTETLPGGLTRDDLLGALACFVLCVGSALPAAIPFLLFDEPAFALRVSNAVLLVLLFGVGVLWARYTGRSPFRTGLALLALGGALVLIALAFGG
jgi:VIT1/CCC1 family predicted Fe2+/Mn2+ transporter